MINHCLVALEIVMFVQIITFLVYSVRNLIGDGGRFVYEPIDLSVMSIANDVSRTNSDFGP